MAPSRPAALPPVLIAGSLALDTGTRVLTGPTGRENLLIGAYSVLRTMMQQPGVLVTVEQLIASIYPEANLEPEDATRAVRCRVHAARAAVGRVGLPRAKLRTVYAGGYALDVADAQVVRVFTAGQAAMLDHLLATHPDQHGAQMVRA